MRLVTTALSAALLAAPASAQDAHDYVAERVDAREDMAVDTAEKLWNWAEVGYQETQSTDLLQSRLESEGFEIEEGVAGIPTAFIGEWGEGGPVIAILAEMDALPGISQSASPTRWSLSAAAPPNDPRRSAIMPHCKSPPELSWPGEGGGGKTRKQVAQRKLNSFFSE